MLLGLFLLTAVRGVAAEPITGGPEGVAAGDSVTRISAVQVKIDAPPALQGRYRTMAQALIRLQPGEPLSPSAIQASVEALRLSRRFRAVHVDAIAENAGDRLVFTLKPQRYVQDIKIRGEYPLFENDVLNQMTLYPGNPYQPSELAAQTAAIVRRYQREGYIDPKVSVSTRQESKEANDVILVTIRKGAPYVLGKLTFEGNRAIAAGSLKWRMSVWRSALLPEGRFSEYRLKKDLDALVKYYRRKGFADAALTFRIHKAQNSRRVDVTVQVQEGQCYRVAFKGNRRFWDLTLEKDLVLFKSGNRSNMGIRKSIQKMIQRYREAGFLNVRITAETHVIPADPVEIRQVRFVIQEGPATKVDRVNVAGNRAIPEATIRKQLLTRPPALFHGGAFVPETLDEDVYAVTTLYGEAGFEQRRVDSAVNFNPEQTGADVTLTVDEGPRTRVRAIAITGLTADQESAVRKVLVLRIGGPFRQTALEAEREAIASLVAEQGYPHVTVSARVSYSADHTWAEVVHTVDPGPLVTLGDVFIAGNLRTAEKVIRRELDAHPHTPLSLRSLHEGQRRLRDLAIFRQVDYRLIGLKEKAETVNLCVDVEESKPYYIQLGTGYESDSGLFGRMQLGDHNLLGLNKDLWASSEISETGYRLETRLTEPRFIGTRTSASIGAFNQEVTEFNQPFGTRTTGGSLAFGHDWGDHLTSALSFRLEKRDQFSVEDRPPGEAEEATRTIFVTTPYLRYDSRDSFVRPTQGLLSSLTVDISKGVQNQLDDFFRYQFDTRYYRTPLDGITLAGLARIGQIVSYGESGGVPDDQLFFLGGIQDVRGFKENLLRFDDAGNPVGGKTAMVGSLEARIDLGMNLELTTFFDIGSVQDALVDGGSDRFRSSVGVGLRYVTPIGPMGLLYGHLLDPEEGEASGRFHLSIGYSF